MQQELTPQEQLDALADSVARKLGTHCRTDHLPCSGGDLRRLIVDDNGRGLRLWMPDPRRPERLAICALLPEGSGRAAPTISITARSAVHVAREIKRRLYPLHDAAMAEVAERAAQARREESDRRTVADAVAAMLPHARTTEDDGQFTAITWGDISHLVLNALVGPSGDWVRLELGCRPETAIAVLGAYSRDVEDPDAG
ncbi:hypothetical protein [Streptomyces flavofungini]|uniref:Uncharacterized protein n=1 Tax=Streptomyces flavofungini TaxID=68200 RepID=A0ABS0XGF3_9ACTN|nr:hypothetical protein [Streptomyces flavofungini]MBJ3812305.1 hypothetical protein [Streptomyces flavofungini]GHC88571.1 hypothetical protein GCM10010349_75940 [Streptomyces flavofungini]